MYEYRIVFRIFHYFEKFLDRVIRDPPGCSQGDMYIFHSQIFYKRLFVVILTKINDSLNAHVLEIPESLFLGHSSPIQAFLYFVESRQYFLRDFFRL